MSLPLLAEDSSYFSTRIKKAKPGDYIVANLPGSYCVLILRSKEDDRLVLEEIDVPEFAIDAKTIDWQKWVLSRAPGNSAWGMVAIDLEKKILLDAYSVQNRCFLSLSKEEQLLLGLLSLPTSKLPSQDRRKIGPPPLSGEEDHRSFWQPKIKFDGVLNKESSVIYRAIWPKDNSLLSGCKIDFYFSNRVSDFPFPIWIDIQGSYFKTRLAIIEAGRGFISPAKDMPIRSSSLLKNEL